jgi:hypothetical protein
MDCDSLDASHEESATAWPLAACCFEAFHGRDSRTSIPRVLPNCDRGALGGQVSDSIAPGGF